MSQYFRLDAVGDYGPDLGQVSEPQSFTEHQAALDATVFRQDGALSELVLELDSGELRWRRSS